MESLLCGEDCRQHFTLTLTASVSVQCSHRLTFTLGSTSLPLLRYNHDNRLYPQQLCIVRNCWFWLFNSSNVSGGGGGLVYYWNIKHVCKQCIASTQLSNEGRFVDKEGWYVLECQLLVF